MQLPDFPPKPGREPQGAPSSRPRPPHSASPGEPRAACVPTASQTRAERPGPRRLPAGARKPLRGKRALGGAPKASLSPRPRRHSRLPKSLTPPPRAAPGRPGGSRELYTPAAEAHGICSTPPGTAPPLRDSAVPRVRQLPLPVSSGGAGAEPAVSAGSSPGRKALVPRRKPPDLGLPEEAGSAAGRPRACCRVTGPRARLRAVTSRPRPPRPRPPPAASTPAPSPGRCPGARRRHGPPSAGHLWRPPRGPRRRPRGNRKPVVTPGAPGCRRSLSRHWGAHRPWLWGRTPQPGLGPAAMDALVEDDICILNHEKAHRRDTTPLSMHSDESGASHFALVTAYEDIKKRLNDSEKENSFLKKRVRALEEKLVGARLEEETSCVGREQVNKAYHAYREVCIDRDNLKSQLDKMNKDNSESLKVLNEQLQSKEVELLQLRTEVETQQVMRNLNPPSSNWEVEKLSCELKIHSLEQELELMRKQCGDLNVELQKARQTETSQKDDLQNRDLQRLSVPSDNLQHAYWELRREMSNLHLVTQVQAELLRKLKTPTAVKKACAPGACVDALGKDSTKLHLANLTATYRRHSPLSPSGKAVCHAPSSPVPSDKKALAEKAILQSWTDEKSIPNDGTDFQEHNSFGRNSLEDNSWVFPSPPKSSETTFGETKSKTLSVPNLPPLHYLDQHNQNCLYKN